MTTALGAQAIELLALVLVAAATDQVGVRVVCRSWLAAFSSCDRESLLG